VQKVAALIARRLARLPQPALDAIIMPASYWLESAHKKLYERDPDAFQTVFDKLANILAGSPASAEPRALAPGETRDWVNVSYGSATGHLAGALSGDPALAQIGPQDALPNGAPHGGNTGSNPVGDASNLGHLRDTAANGVPVVSRR
jgi:hypothetical protein